MTIHDTQRSHPPESRIIVLEKSEPQVLDFDFDDGGYKSEHRSFDPIENFVYPN